MVYEGAAGSDFNVMQEVDSEKEQRSGRAAEEEEEEGDAGFGPREDASKEHLLQRPAGSIIAEREAELAPVCVLNGETGRVASVVTDEPGFCGKNTGHSSACSCFSLSLTLCET